MCPGLTSSSLAVSGGRGLRGISFYTGINAINFAKLDTPFSLLQPGHLAEMYFTLGLQCHFSMPHWSRPLMVSVTMATVTMSDGVLPSNSGIISTALVRVV